MTEKDVPAVSYLLNKHLAENYQVHIEFDEAEVAHFLLPQKDVVFTYVVEDESGLTDLISFYSLPSSILDHDKYSTLNAAYAFYNVSKTNDEQGMKTLYKDALILAKNEGFDVFNMTEVMKNQLLVNDMMFKPGDGRLHHYIYNWRIQTLNPE